jgi:hypothetical protein
MDIAATAFVKVTYSINDARRLLGCCRIVQICKGNIALLEKRKISAHFLYRIFLHASAPES